MKQVLQDLRKGHTHMATVPSSRYLSKHLLIQTHFSLISAGTERMLVDFGKASYLQKIRQQPEKAKEVWTKIKTDGLMATWDAVNAKLDQPLPLGYCQVGHVVEMGLSSQFRHGQRVVSNGPHAELVQVPENLCVPVPDAVSDEMAVFTVVASIGLQGIRLAKLSLGESIAVIGTGLIGLLTIQLLKAQGCRVLAIDFDSAKLQLAQRFGAEICDLSHAECDPVQQGLDFSRHRGIDAVFITAATSSNDPIEQAAQMSRKRGRIILVGVTGLELRRSDFYEKELSFQVSCSYGPGRYDPIYEKQGVDYPIGFVRWTAQRNFEAVLDMMADGRLDIHPLITHRFKFDKATDAYQILTQDRSALGILLEYSHDQTLTHQKQIVFHDRPHYDPQKPIISVLGAGQYAARTLIPVLRKNGAQLYGLISERGLSGALVAKKNGFQHTGTDLDAFWSDPKTNTVIIVTRHDSHAYLTVQALKAAKHVFVEKPLALDLPSLADIETAYHATMLEKPIQFMVGFNRRFASHIQTMYQLLRPLSKPKTFIMTVNAGAIPHSHWTQDEAIGGGRILGEVCHFIDLLYYLAGSPVVDFHANALDASGHPRDTVSIHLTFQDGSLGTIHYFSNGAKQFPKERLEVFCDNKILQLDNFKRLRGFGWKTFRKQNVWSQDKGQHACVQAFLTAIETGVPAIPCQELFDVTRLTIQIKEALQHR